MAASRKPGIELPEVLPPGPRSLRAQQLTAAARRSPPATCAARPLPWPTGHKCRCRCCTGGKGSHGASLPAPDTRPLLAGAAAAAQGSLQRRAALRDLLAPSATSPWQGNPHSFGWRSVCTARSWPFSLARLATVQSPVALRAFEAVNLGMLAGEAGCARVRGIHAAPANRSQLLGCDCGTCTHGLEAAAAALAT